MVFLNDSGHFLTVMSLLEICDNDTGAEEINLNRWRQVATATSTATSRPAMRSIPRKPQRQTKQRHVGTERWCCKQIQRGPLLTEMLSLKWFSEKSGKPTKREKFKKDEESGSHSPKQTKSLFSFYRNEVKKLPKRRTGKRFYWYKNRFQNFLVPWSLDVTLFDQNKSLEANSFEKVFLQTQSASRSAWGASGFAIEIICETTH